MKSRADKELWTYLDGELPDSRRRRVEELLVQDAESAQTLQAMSALRSAVRESWSEGPPAPAVDLLIQALRPQLARIGAERAASGRWTRLGDWIAPVLHPTPLTALAGGCAAALFIWFSIPGPTSHPTSLPTSTAFAPISSPDAIYDLEQENPVLVLEVDEGTTLIWMLPEASEDQLSGGFGVGLT